MRIAKDFYFDSAHRLNNYKGKCKNLHGHTYKLRIILEGEVNKNGFVIDFSEFKKIINDAIIEKLDHSYLNDLIKQPTAENIIKWIWNKLEKKLPLYEIWLWETPNSFVIYNKQNK